ncbi:hypothetical protein ASG84_08885 [Rhodococcus sp. Leaf278]|uniref:PucR family transcriptional regulator n=1 Tax=Rhodococcus sp. Leaf278 TaxID=1736319 RepID=UPI00070AD9EF|nr:PucR family transcriptional regulator [Rhodococcus sp. Leaf278]KQU47214.1 hypothetical protein ASG84_08885 [Rhodococcus sp. Leaf278]
MNQPGVQDGESKQVVVLARLASDVPEVIRRTVGQVRELGTYDALSASELAEAIGRNVTDAVETLQANQLPSRHRLTELAETVVRRRIAQGIPVEDMMRTYRSSLAVINDRFIELAMEADIDPREALRSSRLLWSLSDAFMTCVALEYQRLSVESALLDDQAKADLLQGLLFGTGNMAEMTRACETRGLDPAGSFYAVRARAAGTGTLSTICRDLQHQGAGSGGIAVVSPFRGDAIGLLPAVPHAVKDAVVAVGAPLPLPHIAQSFATASRVLDAAVRLGRAGVLEMPDLSWRITALGDVEISGLLHERYIAPLEDRGEFGEQLLQSVRYYLASDRNIPAAADAMFVHKNTLRYRLRKFEELTSVSLESTDTIVELAWALEVAAATSMPSAPER